MKELSQTCDLHNKICGHSTPCVVGNCAKLPNLRHCDARLHFAGTTDRLIVQLKTLLNLS